MISKLGYLIGTTRLLTVEEAVTLTETLQKGKVVGGPVSEIEGAPRYFPQLPGIRHMRTRAGVDFAGPSFEVPSLTAEPVNEEILYRLLNEAPEALQLQVNLLKSERKPRAGLNSFHDADGSRLWIAREVDSDCCHVSISVNTRFGPVFHRTAAQWRTLVNLAGFDEAQIRVFEDAEGVPQVQLDPTLPFATKENRGQIPNQLVIDTDNVFQPPALTGGWLRLLRFRASAHGPEKSTELWERVRKIWVSWRAELPATHETWEVQVNAPVSHWEECREWINAHLPGPFQAYVGWGSASEDVTAILKEETEEGQYVELSWKRVRGRVALVSATRRKDGWVLQLSGVNELNAKNAAATREAFLKMAGRGDLFVPGKEREGDGCA